MVVGQLLSGVAVLQLGAAYEQQAADVVCFAAAAHFDPAESGGVGGQSGRFTPNFQSPVAAIVEQAQADLLEYSGIAKVGGEPGTSQRGEVVDSYPVEDAYSRWVEGHKRIFAHVIVE